MRAAVNACFPQVELGRSWKHNVRAMQQGLASSLEACHSKRLLQHVSKDSKLKSASDALRRRFDRLRLCKFKSAMHWILHLQVLYAQRRAGHAKHEWEEACTTVTASPICSFCRFRGTEWERTDSSQPCVRGCGDARCLLWPSVAQASPQHRRRLTRTSRLARWCTSQMRTSTSLQKQDCRGL